MTAIPSSTDAEKAIIGAAITKPEGIPELAGIVQPADFYNPSLGTAWAVITDTWRNGHTVSATLVADLIRPTVAHATQILADCIGTFTGTEAARALALRVADLAATRRIQALVHGTLEQIGQNPDTDPTILAEQLTADLAGIDFANDTRPVDGLWSMSEMVAADWPRPPAVIPGFLREMDRLLLVGVEGGGKSVLLRQLAAMAAAGKHPFTSTPIEPVRTLIIDVENPEDVIVDGLKLMPRPSGDLQPMILSRPGGINIRKRADRNLLHRVCEQVQPRLVTIGPLYKLHRAENGESDEDAAVRAQNILDDLRARFRCALVIEHHAPKGSENFRKLVPFGSSAWLRWPEFGWTLVPHSADRDGTMGRDTEEGKSLRLGTFRGDRITVDKPARFDRGKPWPWAPYWPEGMPPRTEEQF